MHSGSANVSSPPTSPSLWTSRPHRAWLNYCGRQLLNLIDTVHGVGAFALITLGVTVTKSNRAAGVVRPLILRQIHQAGVRLLPVVSFIAVALGLVIISQTVALLSSVGAQQYTGTVMVTVVVRELGPLVAALLVLARVGTPTVIELGTTRALGEVEALEALGIDPIHYLVVPRVIGQAVAVLALTIYLVIIALVSGYVFAFLQDVPLTPGDYFRQIAGALTWQDFILIALKTVCFGIIIAVVTCFQGLARPLRLEQVAEAATRAIVQSLVACVLLNAVFIFFFVFLLM
jgi:phospholipid/cholesterol/gamma-HCH transport system permease protein